MKCMHCLVEFHAEEDCRYIGGDIDGYWFTLSYKCPACGKMNMFLGVSAEYKISQKMQNFLKSYPINPKGSSRPPCPPEVPRTIAEDYEEACVVLADSPKASAALSRRCLQNILRDAGGASPKDLAKEIDQIIDGGKLPSHLEKALDMVRTIGNFAAHPVKSESTGEIVPVEPNEASFNLDVLEELFDFYYVKPKRVLEKLGALNSKLTDAGKKPIE